MKKSLLIILTMLVLLATGLQAKQKLSGQGTRSLRDAKMKLQQKNYDKALEFYNTVLETDPNSVEALVKIGQINYTFGSERSKNKVNYYAEAYKSYKAAIEAYDKLIEEGIKPKKLKNEKKDIDRLREKELMFPVQKILVIGQTLATDDEEYEEAIVAYDKVIELDPENVTALQLKASAYLNLEQNDNAIATYELIKEKAPEDTQSLNQLAALYFNAEKPEKAIETYQALLAVTPNDINVLFNISIAFSNLEKYAKALEYTEMAIAIEPENLDALDNASQFANVLGETDKALDYGKKVADLDPKAERFEFLCYALSNAKKYDDLLVYSKKFHEAAPDRIEAVRLVLVAAQQLGDKDTVTEYSKKLKAFDK